MSFHFQQLKNMKNLLTLADPCVDKSKALSLVLHCCDISHPAKKWDLHHKWTMLLLEEFFRQGDLERELGLPFSPLCDRNNTLVAESQIGFIEFIVEPSMAVCSDMLEIILAPIAPIANSTNNNNLSNKAISSSISVDLSTNTLNVPEEFEASNEATICETIGEKPVNEESEKPSRFKIKKPWVTCLAENKKVWKEQAIKGDITILFFYSYFVLCIWALRQILLPSNLNTFFSLLNRVRKKTFFGSVRRLKHIKLHV
jgi:hypothetical protein